MTRVCDRRDGGFALIEAIAVLFIAALVFMSISASGGLIVRHADAIANRTNESELLIAGVDTWRHDVSGIFLPASADRPVEGLGLYGNGSHLGFVTANHGLDAPAELVVYSAEGESLLRRGMRLDLPGKTFDDARMSRASVLMTGPYRYRFDYLPHEGASSHWQMSWHNPHALPAALRLTVASRNMGTVMAVAIAPIHANWTFSCANDACPGGGRD